MTQKIEKLLKEIQQEQKAQRKMLVTLLARTSPSATADDVAKQLREVLHEDEPKEVYEDLASEILRSSEVNVR